MLPPTGIARPATAEVAATAAVPTPLPAATLDLALMALVAVPTATHALRPRTGAAHSGATAGTVRNTVELAVILRTASAGRR